MKARFVPLVLALVTLFFAYTGTVTAKINKTDLSKMIEALRHYTLSYCYDQDARLMSKQFATRILQAQGDMSEDEKLHLQAALYELQLAKDELNRAHHQKDEAAYSRCADHVRKSLPILESLKKQQ